MRRISRKPGGVWVGVAATCAGVCAALAPAQPSAAAPAPPPPARELAFTLNVAASFGEIDGFLQTSAGGESGTSSPRRPTFDEIGIKEVVVMDVGGTLTWRRENVIARARIMQPSGDTVLEDDLLSQGQSFDGGTVVETDTNFNQYLFAYGHDFDVARNIVVRPLAGVTVLNIRYEIEGTASGGPAVSSKHAHAAAQFGADVMWRPGGGKFSLAARGLASLPLDGLAEVYEADLQFRYDVRRRASGEPIATVFAGVGFQHLEYDDGYKKDQGNQFDADLGPMLMIGFDLRF